MLRKKTRIAYSTPPDSLAGFKGPTFNRVGEEGRRKERRKERAERRRKGILGKGRESPPSPFHIPGCMQQTLSSVSVICAGKTVTDNI